MFFRHIQTPTTCPSAESLSVHSQPPAASHMRGRTNWSQTTRCSASHAADVSNLCSDSIVRAAGPSDITPENWTRMKTSQPAWESHHSWELFMCVTQRNDRPSVSSHSVIHHIIFCQERQNTTISLNLEGTWSYKRAGNQWVIRGSVPASLSSQMEEEINTSMGWCARTVCWGIPGGRRSILLLLLQRTFHRGMNFSSSSPPEINQTWGCRGFLLSPGGEVSSCCCFYNRW